MELTSEEVRVLGCLIEKGATTPDHYPLSTNALVNACNQKSSREPVVAYSEVQVVEAVLGVRQNGLARTNGSGRSDKHRHILPDALDLTDDEVALLAIMLLRGPQSPGELKTRTERYETSQGSGFETLDDIEAVLAGLAGRNEPLVVNIGRGSGQSQDRWAHLLGDGEPDAPTADAVPGDARSDGPSLAQRVAHLEARLARLEAALGVTDEHPVDDADGDPLAKTDDEHPVDDADGDPLAKTDDDPDVTVGDGGPGLRSDDAVGPRGEADAVDEASLDSAEIQATPSGVYHGDGEAAEE